MQSVPSVHPVDQLQFLFMTFVQNQEIIMPENVGYITELIANYCYKSQPHCIGASWCEFVHVLFSTLPIEECAHVNSFYRL